MIRLSFVCSCLPAYGIFNFYSLFTQTGIEQKHKTNKKVGFFSKLIHKNQFEFRVEKNSAINISFNAINDADSNIVFHCDYYCYTVIHILLTIQHYTR